MGRGEIWGDEQRRNIRGREGWVGERYERGNEGGINISGMGGEYAMFYLDNHLRE